MKRLFFPIVIVAFFTLNLSSCDREEDVINNTPTPIDTTPTEPSEPRDTTPSIGGFDENGASNSLFSVSVTHKVHFSKGNLQYRPSDGTWRFAEMQFHYIGTSNQNISSLYDSWIDLFGWGTSGWNSGATSYLPWDTNANYSYYYPGGSYENNLTGNFSNADWGVYNLIENGGNLTGMWRTLTSDEWSYLLNEREDAIVKYGLGIIEGTYYGLIILPDRWTLPSELKFISGTHDFSDNKYTLEQWLLMENAGAIFLPAAGQRHGSTIYYSGTHGHYWSSIAKDESLAYGIHFKTLLTTIDNDWRYLGRSVRLVRD